MSAALSLDTTDESGVHEIVFAQLVLTPELLAGGLVVPIYDPQRDATLVAVQGGIAVWRYPYGGEEKAAKASTPKSKVEANDDADPAAIEDEPHETEPAVLRLAATVDARTKRLQEPWRTITREAQAILRRRGPSRSYEAERENFGQYVSLAAWERVGDAPADRAKAEARTIAKSAARDFRMGIRRRRDGLLDHACNGREADSYADDYVTDDRDGGREERVVTPPPVIGPFVVAEWTHEEIETLGESIREQVERLASKGVLAEDLIIEMIDREREPERAYWSDLRMLAEILYCEEKDTRALPHVPNHDTGIIAAIESSPTAAALLMLALGYRPAGVVIGTDLEHVKKPLVEMFKKRKSRAKKKST